MTNSNKTFCVVIRKELKVSKCPLPSGACMWKHRETRICTYDEKIANSELTVNEYTERVGLPPADPDIFSILKNSLLDKIKYELLS